MVCFLTADDLVRRYPGMTIELAEQFLHVYENIIRSHMKLAVDEFLNHKIKDWIPNEQ